MMTYCGARGARSGDLGSSARRLVVWQARLALCWFCACGGNADTRSDAQVTSPLPAAGANAAGGRDSLSGGLDTGSGMERAGEPSPAPASMMDAAAPPAEGPDAGAQSPAGRSGAEPRDAAPTPMRMHDAGPPSPGALQDGAPMDHDPPHDSGLTASDAPHDGGLTASDAPHDAGHDAGTPTMDGAVPQHDGAVPQHDGAVPQHDGAVPQHDGAVPQHDGSMPSSDGGVMQDGGSEMPRRRCPTQHAVDPRDDTTADAPTTIRVGFSRDVELPQPMVDWMTEHELEAAHIGWHETRRWDQLCERSFAPADGCDYAQQLLTDALWRSDMQQGAPGSGLAFLAMHRHMIMQLKAAFPKHSALLSAFGHVPRSQSDAENPTPWKTITWTRDNLQGFDILENIEANVALFPTQDDLGRFIESNVVWTPQVPAQASSEPGVGVHAALHNQWSVTRSPADLGRFDTALHNYVFWKLHGWIDEIWERYRAAKALRDDDAAYLKVLDDECYRMYLLQPSHRAEFVPSVQSPAP